MATGNLQIGRSFCPSCGIMRTVERNANVWGAGDIVMTLFTCGMWILVRFLARSRWRCSVCGTVTN